MNRKDATPIMAMLLKEKGFDFIPEHKFHPTRRWRFDFAFEPVPVTDEQIIRLRELKATGLPLKEARLIAIPNSSESYAAALWSGARRANVKPAKHA